MFVYIKHDMAKTSKLSVNIDEDLKEEFKASCKAMRVEMTDVVISAIIKFTEKSKSKTKN